PNGAFRGFGAPQSQFACERQMDRIARELGLSPLAVRRRNLLRDGDELPFGQILPAGGAGAGAVLESVLRMSGYETRRRDIAAGNGAAAPLGPSWNRSEEPPPDQNRQRNALHKRARTGGEERNPSPSRQPRASSARAPTRDLPRRPPLRGVGLALYLHGGGFTGAGEERIEGEVAVRFTRDDTVEILTSNVELGQGASTVLSMIAAQALGVPAEIVRHVDPDTSAVPDSGPTVASRTTMIVGRILVDACRNMMERLPSGDFLEEARRCVKLHGSLEGRAAYHPPKGRAWDEESYRGDAYKAYSWGAHVVEVEVDPWTMTVRPLKASVVVEIGRAIHPVLAAGQVAGGALQGMAYGYLEELKHAGGRALNDRMATYIIPTILDTPEISVGIEELPYAGGPYGAKGLGELPFNGGAPAIAAAVEDATGIAVDELPITPERLLQSAIDPRAGRGQGGTKDDAD
ncbi:MAG: molybdopterin-dependent oxidoreductase, partial [Candidatus Eisenbacteria bacterium]|nr:molybdopterin-dependent oxidoreductase [Candidatus Eisenbacteria bacterium]